MGKYKNKIILAVAVLALLAFSFFYGGDSPKDKVIETQGTSQEKIETTTQAETQGETEQTTEQTTQEEIETTQAETQEETEQTTEQTTQAETKQTTEQTTQKETENPSPIPPQDMVVGDDEFKVKISISCATVLNNMDKIIEEKKDIVPQDGVILKEIEVTAYQGESVFNILQRTCKQNKIHMEFVNVPLYNSAYIEGISNIYEFDVGELSGWMYSVNGWFPNYGSSCYQLKDGDVIKWKYSCDLGKDIGGRNILGE